MSTTGPKQTHLHCCATPPWLQQPFKTTSFYCGSRYNMYFVATELVYKAQPNRNPRVAPYATAVREGQPEMAGSIRDCRTRDKTAVTVQGVSETKRS